MRFFVKSIKLAIGTLITIYVALPVCIYFFPIMHHHFLFMNMVKWPFTNYTNSRRLGVQYACRNFALKTEEDISIGVWHIIPKSLNASAAQVDPRFYNFDNLLSREGKPIIVYLHGNTWTRSAPHRVKLYNILAGADYHLIAFDYRGYGDSTGSPSEEGVVLDTLSVYKWAKKRAGSNPLFVWSHSLGTAIGTAAVKRLCETGDCPAGFILEAPFNNLGSIIRHHPLTKPFRWMPWFDKVLVEPFQFLGLHFTTDERIRDIHCPLLIMHARDDRVIPFHLGEMLKDEAVKHGKDVTFKEYGEQFNYGHKYICTAPDFLSVINQFITKCIEKLKSVNDVN